MYKILESKITFEDFKPTLIALLVEYSENDIRCIVSTNKEKSGYYFIKWFDVLNNDLLQSVAGYGMETDYKKYFPDAKTKYLKRKS
jgi:hypothetical protein